MQPRWHILLGFIFSYLIAYLFNLSLWHFGVLFFSTWFFIDLDHVVLYILETNNFSPKKFLEHHSLEKSKRNLLSNKERLTQEFPQFFMHGIEFLIFLAILSFLNETFLFILIGFIFHLILDLACMLFEKEDIFLKCSQIYTYIKNKKARKLKRA